MSLRVSTLVWLVLAFESSELTVMLALADWADDDGGRLYPSMTAIAKKARLSKDQARRVVHRLISDGWLQVTGNAHGGAPGSTRQYRIAVDRLEQTARIHATPTTGAGASPTAGTHAGDGLHAAPRRLASVQAKPLENREETIKDARELAEVCNANRVTAVDAQQLRQWLSAGTTPEILRQAIARARRQKPVPLSIHANYLVPILAEIRAGGAAGQQDNSWRHDDRKAAALCLELNIPGAKRGEDATAFQARIDQALNERARQAVA